MKTYLIKIGLFLAFCVVSVIIIACSDEFVVSSISDEPIVTTGDLKRVSGFEVNYGMRDSIPLLMIVFNGDTNYAKTNVEGDSTRPYTNALKRTRQFNLKWNKVEGAVDYEVRVYSKPIANKNWTKAQVLEIVELNDTTGKISALVTLDPKAEVMTGKCTGCGKCYQKCPTGAISIASGKAVVNQDKCIECGECFRSCEFDAIKGTFPGSVYYVAIRSINEDGEYSEEIESLSDPIKLRYTILSQIPDTDKDPQVQKLGGCIGNCNFEGCYIAFPENNVCTAIENDLRKRGNSEYGNAPNSVCPVDAIYEVDTTALDTSVIKYGAIKIDKDKCINCGRCVMQCWADGPYGSVTSEIVKAVSRIF